MLPAMDFESYSHAPFGDLIADDQSMVVGASDGCHMVSFDDLAYATAFFPGDHFFSSALPSPDSAHGVQSSQSWGPSHHHHQPHHNYHHNQPNQHNHHHQPNHHQQPSQHLHHHHAHHHPAHPSSTSLSSDNESMACGYSGSDVPFTASTAASSTYSSLSPPALRKPSTESVQSHRAAFKPISKQSQLHNQVSRQSPAPTKQEADVEADMAMGEDEDEDENDEEEDDQDQDVMPKPGVSPKQAAQPQPQPTPKKRKAKRKKSRWTALERNRAAATKSRKKKKSVEDALVQSKEELEEIHAELQAQRDSLVKEIVHFKQAILQHAHCGDRTIDTWIKDGADSFAKHV